ncbi:MAG: glycoside hydrolase family 28 protein [Clostridiales bacterium]|nr:glycoside hydrolase family 28 protein [Clostridiales bacterium]
MSCFTPFELPTGASIPDRSVSITDFGAVPGGKVKNTPAFQNAIAYLVERGGGRVDVPEGLWLTGPIRLKSCIELHLAAGAEVRFSMDKEDYLPPVYTLFEGVRCYTFSAQIYARECHDIAVTGEGTFNGQGFSWWYMAVIREGVEALYKAGEDDVPVEKRVYATEEQGIRPGLLHFIDCENVTIEGPTFTFSPFWTLHPTWCKNVIVRNITIKNPWVHAPNTDGCNLEGCSRALIDGVYTDTGDDAVCLKSGRDADGRRVGLPCENIIVRHIVAQRSHGGITIGSEMSGGVRNVLVEECEFRNNLIGIWIKTAPERGGYVENIEYHDIKVGHVREYAVCVTMGYYVDDNKPQPIQFMPRIQHIHIDGLTCEYAGTGIMLDGRESSPLEDISLDNIVCHGKINTDIKYVRGLQMTNTRFD